jgi:hypothetical protein
MGPTSEPPAIARPNGAIMSKWNVGSELSWSIGGSELGTLVDARDPDGCDIMVTSDAAHIIGEDFMVGEQCVFFRCTMLFLVYCWMFQSLLCAWHDLIFRILEMSLRSE